MVRETGRVTFSLGQSCILGVLMRFDSNNSKAGFFAWGIRPMLQNMDQQPTTLSESQNRHPRTSSLSALKIDGNT
jgi:hypothetical protein